MHQAINRRHRHHGIREDVIPLAKGLIGCNQQALALIAMGDELK